MTMTPVCTVPQITEERDGVRRRCCASKGYTQEWQRKVYLSFLTSYILLVPTAIMIYCYANIIHVVWIRARAEDPHHAQHVPGGPEKEESPGSPRMSMRRGLVTASKRRVITMTLTVVVGFLVCQTPYFIVSLVRVYSDYRIKLPAMLALSENIVLMHSTLNPVLYGLFTLRSYHLQALLECFTCRDTPVFRGERRLLLHGKCGGKSVKSAGAQNASGQIYREPLDDVSCDRNGVRNDGAVCKDEAMCNDGAVCKDGAVCRDRSWGSDSGKKTGARKRDKSRKQDIKTNVPLLLITNTSAVENSQDATGKSPSKDDTEQRKQTRTSDSERSPPVKWGQDVHGVIQRGSYGNDRSSVSCSQWTPCNVDTNSECYSCV